MCAWLSTLSMYEKKDFRAYNLLKCCYDETNEKKLFEDLRIFKNKKGYETKTLVDWLKDVGLGLKKVVIPKNNNGIDFVMNNLKVGSYYICLLQNINGEITHSVGLEMTTTGIVINDSGNRYPFDGGKGLNKSLDNVKCVGITAIGELTQGNSQHNIPKKDC